MLFHKHWEPRGHTFGTCMSSPNTDLMYVNVPKNASSWTKPNLKDIGWEFYNYHYDHLYNKHAMIVLRDPIERWLSGICEYFTLYHSGINVEQFTPAFYELLMDQVTFDDHTEKQVYFIEGLDPSKCTFFYCNEYYRMAFTQFLKNNGYNVDYSRYNYQHTTDGRSDGDTTRSTFKKVFKHLLDNPKFADRLKEHYKDDYRLIQSVSYYTTHDQRKR